MKRAKRDADLSSHLSRLCALSDGILPPLVAGAGGCGSCGLCWRGGGLRKYVFLCAACGGLSSLLGILFLAVYFLLRSYTSSLVYFETVPTYVPASMVSDPLRMSTSPRMMDFKLNKFAGRDK